MKKNIFLVTQNVRKVKLEDKINSNFHIGKQS
jgi:hypothetical protein